MWRALDILQSGDPLITGFVNGETLICRNRKKRSAPKPILKIEAGTPVEPAHPPTKAHKSYWNHAPPVNGVGKVGVKGEEEAGPHGGGDMRVVPSFALSMDGGQEEDDLTEVCSQMPFVRNGMAPSVDFLIQHFACPTLRGHL